MAQVTDLQTFRAFWRDEIVARNNALAAFTELANNEALDTVKAGIDAPFFVMLPPEFRTIDQRSNNVQQSVDFGFFILKPALDKEDRAEIKTLQNDCFAIYKEIVGRLEYLNEEKDFFGKYHATNTTAEEVGGLFGGNHYGVQVFGQFITNDGIRHDSTKWT
jgi:hypothetical protein